MADVSFLVNGTDLEVAGVRFMEVIEGAHDTPLSRGDLPVYPGRDGARDVDQPFEASILSLGLVVNGGTRQGFNDAYRTLRRLVKPGKTVTLTRNLSYTTGAESHTAAAKFAGLTPAQIAPGVFRMVLKFLILDGVWYGPAETIGAGTVTVKGDVRTQRMTITLPGGVAGPTVTNSTNGYAFTFSGTLATPTDIDNETAQAIRGGIDVSDALTWTKTLPFRLEAGSNTITITSGTVSIEYRPAYL